ncbi:DUF6777 domain-containing protein [Streptomyces pactum]|uniref:DUF6777 domain-containing protein n=1 Tax=Streptomyces pactum TaxID=68249 RepID=A0A1S6J3C3_9ACTN|nr:DUF6777 domain-containing protein [Streptomyces pactum]AQS66234.1 hypothetical protein B1H29_04130 [Streptomyces pactum]
MRTPLGPSGAACLLSLALLAGATGCGAAGADGDPAAEPGGVLHLQPVAAQGPNPFTDSTAVSTATPPPAARTPGSAAAGGAPVALDGLRPLSGGTPGLYGGIRHVGNCDVTRQIGHLAAHPARTRAFAGVAGISAPAVPGHLRGLTPVVLRADTRVTNHGYRDGRATAYQAVLQAGTAVLVDDRGVPRVRCACGNPLKAPAAVGDGAVTRGLPWPGYRPSEVVTVTPAPRTITGLTLVSAVDDTWIERRLGHDTRHDRPVPAPAWATGKPTATSAPSAPPATPAADAPSTSPGPEEVREGTYEGGHENTYDEMRGETYGGTYGGTQEDTYGGTHEGTSLDAFPDTYEDTSPDAFPDTYEDTSPDTYPDDAPAEDSAEPAPESVPDAPDLPGGGTSADVF